MYSFEPQTHQEYEYQGKRFVRFEVEPYYQGAGFKLSNGQNYKQGDYVWLEVQPVKWLVDEKEKIMITEKLIFSGVQFDKEEGYQEEDFEKTDIKKFIDEYVSKDLVQSRGIAEQTRKSSKTTKKNENPYNLDFSEVNETDIIRGAIESNVSVFLHGKPGCGKSARVKQLDPDFIELNLSHLDPELLDGIAGEKEGKAVHIKPPWLEELEEMCKNEPDKIHILFLEELTNASPMMQSKAYGIALDKKVAGRWKLPENARVVAAGNELEDSIVANEMAEPLYGRFAHVNIETNAQNWLEWAVTPDEYYERLDYNGAKPKAKIHPAIYAYISYKGDEVLQTPYNHERPEPYADPRRWQMASDMLYATNNPNVLKSMIGEDLTQDFINFCKIPTISIEDVINENYTEEDYEIGLGQKLATLTGLIKVDSKNMPAVRRFVKKLGPEMVKKFDVQWAGGDEEKLEKIQETILEDEERERIEREQEIERIARSIIANDGRMIFSFYRIPEEYIELINKKVEELKREQLQEKNTDEENQRQEEHSGAEAQETADAGVLSYTKINDNYEKYMSKERDEGKNK